MDCPILCAAKKRARTDIPTANVNCPRFCNDLIHERGPTIGVRNAAEAASGATGNIIPRFEAANLQPLDRQ